MNIINRINNNKQRIPVNVSLLLPLDLNMENFRRFSNVPTLHSDNTCILPLSPNSITHTHQKRL